MTIKNLEEKINNVYLDKARVTAELEALNQEYTEFKEVPLLKERPASPYISVEVLLPGLNVQL